MKAMTMFNSDREERFFEFVRELQVHTGMYVAAEDYSGVSSAVLGYDLGSGGTVLTGFKEWLVAEHGAPPNLAWMSAVLYLVGLSTRGDAAFSREEEDLAVSTLFRFLLEYSQVRKLSPPGD